MQIKAKAKKVDILLIGELIFDVNVYSSLIGTSLETPTIKGFYSNTKIELGGAGKVYSAYLDLNKKCDFITILGSDDKDFNNISKLSKINKFYHDGKPISKTRYWVDNYKLLQINKDNHRKISNLKNIQKKILLKINKSSYNHIVLSDYMHGLFDKSFVEKILHIAKKKKSITYVDQQSSNKKTALEIYKNIDYVIINQNELNLFDKSKKNIREKIKYLSTSLNIPNIVIKLGDQGSVCYANNKFYVSKIYKKINTPTNTAGAGDYFLAKFTCTSNQNIKSRLSLSNKFAYNYILNNSNK